MDTLIQANIFFFISSLSVIIFTFFLVLLVIKLRKLVMTVNSFVEKLKNTSDQMSEEAKELVEDIKQSPIFRLIFPRRKRVSQKPVSGADSRVVRRKV
ncbi:MAG: hypothetical protein QG580_59 [Patescibacteria group bacterium]|jgi:hypothetical protein|nr:hypothetical protein [Patescibacteria group bacterium]